MFQKTSDVFLGRWGAVCSRCISLNKGIPRHRMTGRHPMSNQNEFCLGKRNRFWDYNILYGANDYSPPVPPCSILCPVFRRSDGPLAPYNFPDIGCFKNIRCLLGRASAVCSRCISSSKGFPRHRMSVRHPMSNQNEFGLGNEMGFRIIIFRMVRMIIRPYIELLLLFHYNSEFWGRSPAIVQFDGVSYQEVQSILDKAGVCLDYFLAYLEMSLRSGVGTAFEFRCQCLRKYCFGNLIVGEANQFQI